MMTLSFPTLRGTAAVEELQKALNALSATTGNTALKVHVDGSMGPQTVNATMMAVSIVAGSLDPSIQAALTILQMAIATGDQNKAERTIEAHASAITNGIRAYIAAKVVQAASGGQTTVKPSTQTVGPLKLSWQSVLTKYAGSGQATGQGTLIFAFDPKARVYRIAQPIGVSGRAAYVEVGTSTAKPTTGTEVPFKQYMVALGVLPWYQTWWGMSLIGVGLVGVVGGAVTMMKKRSSKQLTGLGSTRRHGTSKTPILMKKLKAAQFPLSVDRKFGNQNIAKFNNTRELLKNIHALYSNHPGKLKVFDANDKWIADYENGWIH